MGGNFYQLGGNSHRENNHPEETSDILIQSDLQLQVMDIVCAIRDGNFYILGGNFSRF